MATFGAVSVLRQARSHVFVPLPDQQGPAVGACSQPHSEDRGCLICCLQRATPSPSPAPHQWAPIVVFGELLSGQGGSSASERPSANPSDLHLDPAFYFIWVILLNVSKHPGLCKAALRPGGNVVKGTSLEHSISPRGSRLHNSEGSSSPTPPFKEAGPRPLQLVRVSLLGKTLKSKVASAVVKCALYLPPPPLPPNGSPSWSPAPVLVRGGSIPSAECPAPCPVARPGSVRRSADSSGEELSQALSRAFPEHQRFSLLRVIRAPVCTASADI